MRATESGEIEAFRDLFAAAPPELSAEHGIGSLAVGQALVVRVAALSGVNELNHVLGPAAAGDLDAIASFYGDTAHIISVPPEIDLDRELRDRGYTPGYAWMKFRRGVEQPPDAPTDLNVRQVGAEAAADFALTLCQGYGLPEHVALWLAAIPGRAGWQCFVAYDGRKPAAAGALHVHGDVGWLGMAATLPSQRSRGAQNAILAARIARAGECGCSTVVTETGERVEGRPSNSYRNILRAGFEEAYLRPNYASPR